MYFGFDVRADHVNVGVVHRVGDWARLAAQTQPRQLVDLPFEALAEEVVDHRIVYSGALCEHARQEADFRWNGAAVTVNGPQAYQAVGRPTADEANADQNCDLK